MNSKIFILLFSLLLANVASQSYADSCAYCIHNEKDQIITITDLQTRSFYIITPNPLMHTMSLDDIDASVFGDKLIVTDNDNFDVEPMIGTIKISGVNPGIYSIIRLDNDSDMEYNTYSTSEFPYTKQSKISVKDMTAEDHKDVDTIYDNELPAIMTTNDGMYIVNVHPDGIPTMGDMFRFTIVITDSNDMLVNDVSYDVVAMQDNNHVLTETNVHVREGMKEHTTATILESNSPVKVLVTIQRSNSSTTVSHNDNMNEILEFNIIPEFGSLTIMILAIAFISIIALMSKSRFLQTTRI